MRASRIPFRRAAPEPVGLRGYDHRAFAKDLVVENDGVSPVQQHEVGKVDINTIVRRFMTQGAPMPLTRREGVFGDFSGVHDFDSALARVEEARAEFMKLPPETREYFHNSPGEFLARLDELELFEEPEAPSVSGGATVDTGASGGTPPT